MTDQLTDNIERKLHTLKLGEAYWQRGYIENSRKELFRLRSLKSCWIGSIEHDLKREVDEYLQDHNLLESKQ